MIIGEGQGLGLSDRSICNTQIGEHSHRLTQAEMPTHNHNSIATLIPADTFMPSNDSILGTFFPF